MDKFEEDKEIPSGSTDKLIAILHTMHCDNSRLQYYALRLDGGGPVPQMPITPFVYEYFLFNSLYQYDWETSIRGSSLATHGKGIDGKDLEEFSKQKAFLEFIKQHADKKPADLYRAFEPLIHIGRAEGDWTKVRVAVTPNPRITSDAGEQFFSRILKLQIMLEDCKTPSEFPTSNKKIFDTLKECARFVYLVRNNIFHGSKTLGEILEPNQKRRIEVYDLFLKGITSLFFLASGKDTAACDFVPCPIYSSSLPTTNAGEIADQALILRAIAKKFMKIYDPRLIFRFTKMVTPPLLENTPNKKSSLFYPSADKDFLTPLLLGLPYCTQFYFFEQHHPEKPQSIANNLIGKDGILRRIEGLRILPNPPRWEPTDNRHCFDFEFNGIPRRLHWVHADNKTFLQEDAELKFYFRRGDSSHGATGSGQEWDSKLLPELLKKVPSDVTCIYLTDGEHSGFNERYSAKVFENLPFNGRIFYCGKFSSLSSVAHRFNDIDEQSKT